MRQLFLSVSLLLLLTSARGQNLNNSYWLGTKPPSINLYFHFWNDTIFYSTNGSGYTPMSTYNTVGNQINIFDIMTSACTDTGHYNYAISGNSLHFTVVTDICASRRNTLVNYSWTLMGTLGLAAINSTPEVSAYPNPCIDGLLHLTTGDIGTNDTEINIYDLTGKKVLQQFLKASEPIVDIRNLAKGMYVGQVTTNKRKSSFRIVR